MSDEESSYKAIEQREEQNVLLRALLGSTKALGSAVVLIMLSGLWVLVTDHFKLEEVVRLHGSLFDATKLNSERIGKLERAVIPPQGRWTYGMHMSFSDELKRLNADVIMPDSHAIHDQHLTYLGTNP